MGSRGVAGPVSEAHFRRQWEDPVVGPELRELGLETPELLGSTFLADAAQLRAITRESEPLLDDFPHRLSSRPVYLSESSKSRFVRSMMDVDSVEQRFRSSRLIRRLWPESLRQATLSYFSTQRIVNRLLVYDQDRASSLSNRDLYRTLSRTSLRTIPLWMLGSEAAEQRIVAELAASQPETPALHRLQGVGALAGRDYL